jgi:hypothetical protein
MLAIGAVVLSGFGACMSSRPPYPADWPARLEHTPPAAYSGNYSGTLIPHLNRQALPTEDSLHCSTDFQISPRLDIRYRLQCENHPDSLSHALLALNDPNARIKIREKRKGLLLLYKPLHTAGNPIAGIQREYILLSKATDGSLILKEGAWAYGLIFLIFPTGINEYAWYRIGERSVEMRTKPKKASH